MTGLAWLSQIPCSWYWALLINHPYPGKVGSSGLIIAQYLCDCPPLAGRCRYLALFSFNKARNQPGSWVGLRGSRFHVSLAIFPLIFWPCGLES